MIELIEERIRELKLKLAMAKDKSHIKMLEDLLDTNLSILRSLKEKKKTYLQ